jgi:4-hydroxy-3-polyprenylbenzoate decarboxylase
VATGAAATRVIVAITGASGAVYGVRLLQHLRTHGGIETHLLLSAAGVLNVHQELGLKRGDVERLADVVHNVNDPAASIASGSFLAGAMVIAPCSMKTLAAIAHGFGENLIHRAADVVLKERRKLVLVVREAPLNEIHLENMLKLSRMGVVIFPPVPAFYNHPQNLDDMINHVTMRVLDQFDIHLDVMNRWDGTMLSSSRKA